MQIYRRSFSMNPFSRMRYFFQGRRIERNGLKVSVDLMWKNVDRLSESISQHRNETTHLHQAQAEYFQGLSEKIAGIVKRLSSLEQEMVLNRGGCLDNNFEGKQEL
jgi:hypothetical protein